MTNFTQAFAAIEARPVPTPEQTAAFRRTVAALAPDLLDMVFGDNTKEN